MKLIEAKRIMDARERHPASAAFADGSAHTQGKYRPIADGVVPIQDMGFIHADAAYDVVRASGGYLFRMEDHLERFNASCAKFALQNPRGCNIFLIKDGALKTPAKKCLQGITRQSVIDLADELGIPAEVTAVTATELTQGDAAFLTSTAGGIMPAASANGAPLGGCEGPGPITARLHNLFGEKRWEGWLGERIDYDTPVPGF